MLTRALRAGALALGVLALALASGGAAPARAEAVRATTVDLTLTFAPSSALSALSLDGSAALVRPPFRSTGGPLWITLGTLEVASLAAGGVSNTTFMPGDPCLFAGVCRGSGVLVAYAAAPVVVGRWDVAIQAAAAVPEPPTASLALAGLALIAFARRAGRPKASALESMCSKGEMT